MSKTSPGARARARRRCRATHHDARLLGAHRELDAAARRCELRCVVEQIRRPPARGAPYPRRHRAAVPRSARELVAISPRYPASPSRSPSAATASSATRSLPQLELAAVDAAHVEQVVDQARQLRELALHHARRRAAVGAVARAARSRASRYAAARADCAARAPACEKLALVGVGALQRGGALRGARPRRRGSVAGAAHALAQADDERAGSAKDSCQRSGRGDDRERFRPART